MGEKVLTPKEAFANSVAEFYEINMDAHFLVIAVKIYNDMEIITNSFTNIPNKLKYYMGAYDDNLCLKANPDIKIINYMIC